MVSVYKFYSMHVALSKFTVDSIHDMALEVKISKIEFTISVNIECQFSCNKWSLTGYSSISEHRLLVKR